MYSELANNSFGNEIANKRFLSADGDESEFEDEDSVEYEGEDTDVSVPEADLPKFRTLVKNKKLEMKAQYGKAHFGTEQKCDTIKVPCPTLRNPFKMCDKRVCVNVPKWVWGWRKKWREFKKNGGLAQLKQQAKGLAPITPLVTVAPPSTTNIAPGGLAKNQAKKTETTPNADTTKTATPMPTEKIMGIPKKPFYIGVAVLVLVGGFIAYKKLAK